MPALHKLTALLAWFRCLLLMTLMLGTGSSALAAAQYSGVADYC